MKHFKSLLSTLGLTAMVALAGMYGTADSNLSGAVTSVTSYFSANIGTVITAVVGIAVFLWLLRLAFRSFGVRKPTSVG